MMKRETSRSLRSRIVEELYTYCAFWIAVSALPALAISYVVVRLSKHLWLRLLSSRYPSLDFIKSYTIRTLLDTHRNQGIINVLLCVKGPLNADAVRNTLTQHVIDRKDQNGELMFPRLRHVLVSCWGNYAWDANAPFRPESHLIVASGVYRGRPVTDSNIQDYVSDIVSKYFPPDQPPWQYIIIPCVSLDPKFYILVRVHHLLLTGKKSLNIGDLLLIRQLSPDQMVEETENYQQSPLGQLLLNFSAIPELYGKLNESLSNIWNEFISEYDPMESPHAMKTLPGAFHVAGLILISTASALRDLSKKKSDEGHQSTITATTFLAAVQRECKRRSLTAPKILLAPLVTVDPRKWPKRMFQTVVLTTRTMWTLPMRIHDEVRAIKELRMKGQVTQVSTFTWKYGELGQLWVKATKEAWQGFVQAYKAPAQLWSNTIGADDGKKHMLQTSSLCGRKVTSWSRPVPREAIERAARALGVSSTDIALFAATEALRAFFAHAQRETPDSVLLTARAASEDFLFTFSEGDGKRMKKDHTGGMICLSVPIGATPRRISSVIDEACKGQSALAAIWAAQARCGAVTRAVPSLFARITLNVLSRRYAVSYAEINAPVNAEQRTTLWGQTVEEILYWRPPQANISMSLTVIQYADTVRLAVMADAQLTPAHTVPATRWPAAVEQLINKIDQEITRITRQSVSQSDKQTHNIPQIILPRESSTEPEEDSEEPIHGSLRPLKVTAVSPPPNRKRPVETKQL